MKCYDDFFLCWRAAIYFFKSKEEILQSQENQTDSRLFRHMPVRFFVTKELRSRELPPDMTSEDDQQKNGDCKNLVKTQHFEHV